MYVLQYYMLYNVVKIFMFFHSGVRVYVLQNYMLYNVVKIFMLFNRLLRLDISQIDVKKKGS